MDKEQSFQDIEDHYDKKLPFAVYRKPNEAFIKAILQSDDQIHKAGNFNRNGFVFAPFDDEQAAILIPIDTSESIKFETLLPDNSLSDQTDNSEDLAAKKDHISLIEEALEVLSSDRLKKVVLSRKEEVMLQDPDPLVIFKRLVNTYPTAFVYCWYHPKIGLWLGATPESLLEIKGNMLNTMALAGTQPFAGSLEVNWGEKEKTEQRIVTDYIENSLKSLVTSIVRSDAQTVQAGSLLHLRTLIKARLRSGSANLEKIIKALHPTPAVCGLPKDEAKQYILDNEHYDREFYTGFLGEVHSEGVELYVNLRCMQLKEGQAILYIGGGITKDSRPENEWEETVNKAKIIKRVL